MDIAELTDRFLRMEDELGLFEGRVDGVAYWERVRFLAHRRAQEASGVMRAAHDHHGAPWRDRARRAWNTLKGLPMHPFGAGPREVLVYGHPRRQPTGDGRWVDIYSDPVIEALGRDHLLLEPPLLSRHRGPAVTPEVRHLDLVYNLRDLKSRLGLNRTRLPPAERTRLERAGARLAEEMGATVDLVAMVRRDLQDRANALPLYHRVLERVDPRVVLVVVSYGAETLIEACKARGVPVAELQHGVVSPFHLGYSYPGPGRTKETFPDHFLAFGEYWVDTVELPLPRERVHVVGFPHLEGERQRHRSKGPVGDPAGGGDGDGAGDVGGGGGGRVLFVSQGSVGVELSRVAADLAHRAPEREVVYKLHPGEVARWPRDYPELHESPARVIAHSDVSLYALFAEADVQVGVYSTALFEGLSYGLRTLLFDRPGVEAMAPLVAEGAAETFRDADALHALLTKGGAAPVDPSRYFAPDATRRVREAVEAMLAGRGAAAAQQR